MNTYDKNTGILLTDKHVFFYANRCPFSNFYYPSKFTYSYANEKHDFMTSEQAFMWTKAMYFKDFETANDILIYPSDPARCKELGRMVKNYNDFAWNSIRYQVFYAVNFEKFSQNEELKKFILNDAFDNKTFVEASPYDGIWGIKMKITDQGIDDERNWKGKNLLGKVLTDVRNDLKKVSV